MRTVTVKVTVSECPNGHSWTATVEDPKDHCRVCEERASREEEWWFNNRGESWLQTRMLVG